MWLAGDIYLGHHTRSTMWKTLNSSTRAALAFLRIPQKNIPVLIMSTHMTPDYVGGAYPTFHHRASYLIIDVNMFALKPPAGAKSRLAAAAV
jgi:hypothetical protein